MSEPGDTPPGDEPGDKPADGNPGSHRDPCEDIPGGHDPHDAPSRRGRRRRLRPPRQRRAIIVIDKRRRTPELPEREPERC